MVWLSLPVPLLCHVGNRRHAEELRNQHSWLTQPAAPDRDTLLQVQSSQPVLSSTQPNFRSKSAEEPELEPRPPAFPSHALTPGQLSLRTERSHCHSAAVKQTGPPHEGYRQQRTALLIPTLPEISGVTVSYVRPFVLDSYRLKQYLCMTQKSIQTDPEPSFEREASFWHKSRACFNRRTLLIVLCSPSLQPLCSVGLGIMCCFHLLTSSSDYTIPPPLLQGSARSRIRSSRHSKHEGPDANGPRCGDEYKIWAVFSL